MLLWGNKIAVHHHILKPSCCVKHLVVHYYLLVIDIHSRYEFRKAINKHSIDLR